MKLGGVTQLVSRCAIESPVDEKRFTIQFIRREILSTYADEGFANGEERL